MDLQSQGRRDPSGGSSANSCPWASSGQGARKVCAAGTRPLAWKDLDRRTVPHAAPSSRGQQLSSRYQSKCPGPPTATAPVAGAGGVCSHLCGPVLPTVTPPGLGGQQAASSELRDNSLL